MLPAEVCADTLHDLEQAVADLGLEPGKILEPIRLDASIIQWANENISRHTPSDHRLKILLDKLQHDETLAFEYRAGYTGTAQEVFETGQYNCLSFSMLFVSLAREIGLPAEYLKVDRVERYEREGDLVVLSRHITAGYGTLMDRTILEFDVGPEVNYSLANSISDLEALALYYSNRGTELLRAGDLPAAIEMLNIAVTLGPKSSQHWINLGVAKRRSGDLRGAEESYLEALELDRGNPTAFHNIIALMRMRGEPDAAGRLLEELSGRKNRNPFTYLALGDLSLGQERYRDAERFYRRALKLAKHEAETHAAMGLWALASGRHDKAQSWLEKADAIDARNQRVLELRTRMGNRPSAE